MSSNILDQQQQAANQNTAAEEPVKTALKDVHTFLPGIVHSFDPGTQTAQVQPTIKRVFTEKGPVNLPLCVDVPVYFFKTGPFAVTGPVTAGDECLLGFFERAIDNWFASGGIQEPSEYRLHDLSDGFAIVGISSLAKLIEGFNATDYEIRLLDGSAKVQMKPDGTITNMNAGGNTVLSPGGTFTVNAANIIFNGNVTTNGSTHTNGGTTLNGDLNSTGQGTFFGDVNAAGKSTSTHHHLEHDNFPTSAPV
ncbi:MAG: hypothetical protein E6R08_06450 [Nevskiaceae bacterium]|nr:MAG: hypothetical protein E6R08_06450 [Nevskiaceae bacterium]